MMNIDEFKNYVREIIDDAKANHNALDLSIALDELSDELTENLVIVPGPNFPKQS